MTEKSEIHPSFRRKEVFFLECNSCEAIICRRAMQSVLLSDTELVLYSTDCPERRLVDVTGEKFSTENCDCQLENIACTFCGSVLGYHVRLPCQSCLRSCNNGHLWMFYTDRISSFERLNKEGDDILLWGNIPQEIHDHTYEFLQEECLR
ncbi:hypothetical protein FSP39_018393 [Pinctada imbricata]|uniref:Protein FAM72A n=1 Tax=Pinctada imbricata TaxID=66713 RepID=A0AA88YNS2_PINIB|nr:hypothetical protein FSP39_018393 [Pinctada imbricata]